jgi:hypothetical protein
MSTPTSAPPPATAPVQLYNYRIADIAPTVVSERIGDSIGFTYDVLTQAAQFTFNSRPYIYVSGAPLPIAGTSTSALVQNVNEIQEVCFGNGLADPVTQADLSKVSVAGLEIIVKAAFDTLYNQQAAANAPPNATLPFPSQQAIAQANALFDLFGNGLNGFPLGRAFGGLGTTDEAPVPTPSP